MSETGDKIRCDACPVMCNIRPGLTGACDRYANADGELNLGPLGPKEGYGFSNNVRPFLAPPSLESALFPVAAGDTRVTIRLHYPPLS